MFGAAIVFGLEALNKARETAYRVMKIEKRLNSIERGEAIEKRLRTQHPDWPELLIQAAIPSESDDPLAIREEQERFVELKKKLKRG